MQILAHRGYWNTSIKANSPEAIYTALERGYGFESDVRDYAGHMVISHNIADNFSQDAEDVYKWLHKYNDKLCFATNIKSDGLKEIIKEYITKYDIKNYFLFDMSIPQMVEFRDSGLRFFTRQSEVEKEEVLYDDAAGVWIDGFWGTDWITEELLRKHFDNKKNVCLVSPDLHGRDYRSFWEQLAEYDIDFQYVMLCTDHPDEARKYFKNKL